MTRSGTLRRFTFIFARIGTIGDAVGYRVDGAKDGCLDKVGEIEGLRVGVIGAGVPTKGARVTGSDVTGFFDGGLVTGEAEGSDRVGLWDGTSGHGNSRMRP